MAKRFLVEVTTIDEHDQDVSKLVRDANSERFDPWFHNHMLWAFDHGHIVEIHKYVLPEGAIIIDA